MSTSSAGGQRVGPSGAFVISQGSDDTKRCVQATRATAAQSPPAASDTRRATALGTVAGMEMAHDEGTLIDATFHRHRTADESLSRAVVLVEGVSDQLALEALAMRRGRNLDAENVSIVPMGGATNIATFLDLLGPHGLDVRLAGLCDAGEEGAFKRGLERAGIGSNLTRAGMEQLGFYVCVADLEDELIRSLGVTAVEQVIRAQGELESFRTFQRQPAWRGRTNEEQLRRFFGTHKGRKIQSASLLVGALHLNRVPRPLDGVLANV